MNEVLGFYSRSEVQTITTLSRVTLWRRIKDGNFPPPVQISPGRVAWTRRSIHEWLRQHGAAPADGVAA